MDPENSHLVCLSYSGEEKKSLFLKTNYFTFFILLKISSNQKSFQKDLIVGKNDVSGLITRKLKECGVSW